MIVRSDQKPSKDVSVKTRNRSDSVGLGLDGASDSIFPLLSDRPFACSRSIHAWREGIAGEIAVDGRFCDR